MSRNLRIAAASALGLSAPMALELRRELTWWAWSRVEAYRNRRTLRSGRAIGLMGTGYAELLPFEESRPGRSHVSVLLDFSVVSPGTERANYLRLPNTSGGILGIPGYSGAGVILEVGAGITEYAVGQRVAVAKARHASLANVGVEDVYAIPDDVDARHAAAVWLGVTSGHAVTLAGLGEGDSFCVVGAGLIGLLAQRLASVRGGVSVATVARSARAEASAQSERFVLASDAGAVERIDARVVFEATGSPDGVKAAIDAAGIGGRIVLLGSPRGVTRGFPSDLVRRKSLELIGAHVNTATQRDARREGEAYIRALADGSLIVADLIGTEVDPREAGLFYRELVRNPDLRGGYFDWTTLPLNERLSPGHLLRPPSLRARGVDFQRRPLTSHDRRDRERNILAPSDPLAGAAGALRLGFLGCGDIAMDNAIGATLAPNVELVACYDPITTLSSEMGRRFDIRAYPTVEHLLDDDTIDAVMIAVPHHLHAELALKTADAGKHVIVEKPPAQDLATAIRMSEGVAASHGVTLTVAFPRRYHPNVLVAKRLVELGLIGAFCGAYIRVLADRRPGYWVGGYHGRATSDWRSSREQAGGGILIMNASHYIDLLYHISGAEVEAVSALAASPDEGREVEESISLNVRFRDGAAGSLMACDALRGVDFYPELRVWGGDGHIAIEPDGRFFTLRAHDGIRTARWQRFGVPQVSEPDLKAAFFSRFATALARGEEPDVTVSQAVRVQAFIEAAYESSRLGREVRISEVIEGRGT